MLVVVVILGVVAAVGTSSFTSLVRRERTNHVTTELARWLDQANRDATRFNAQSGGTPCTVTINNGSLVSGNVLATITPAACASESTLRVPDLYGNAPNAIITANPTSFVFTPRGSVATTTGAALPNNEVMITTKLNDRPPKRCVRLSGLVGVMELGSNPQVTSLCNQWGRV
jgi:Tfp pilus assembly protein FimT